MKYIYFFQIDNIDGYIKVGQTDDVYRRLGDYYAFPYDIRVLGFIEPDILTEDMILHLFSDYRLRPEREKSEWFIPDKFIYECIDKLLNGSELEIHELYMQSPIIPKAKVEQKPTKMMTRMEISKHWQDIGLVNNGL